MSQTAQQSQMVPSPAIVLEHDQYDPLPSVWQGGDAELLEKMLRFYPKSPPDQILDATVNYGRFWKGSTRRVIGLDIDSRYRPTIVGDGMTMPFRDEAFDVVVYDPPHVPNQGKDRSKDFTDRFGLRLRSASETGYNLSHTYGPFLREAYRVLVPQAILLCKITDYVHNHRFQWAHIDLVGSADDAGFCACDCTKYEKSR